MIFLPEIYLEIMLCVLQIDIIPAPLQDSCYLDDLSFYHILLKVKTQAQVKL